MRVCVFLHSEVIPICGSIPFLFVRNKPVQMGIAHTGIPRPLMLIEPLDYPAKEAKIVLDAIVTLRTLSVGQIDAFFLVC